MFLFCYTRVSLGQKICLDFHSSNWSQPCGTVQKYMDGGAATASCLSRCGGHKELGWTGTDLVREKESESERASKPQRNRTETLRHTHRNINEENNKGKGGMIGGMTDRPKQQAMRKTVTQRGNKRQGEMASHAEAQEGKTQVREVEKLERLGGPREEKRQNGKKSCGRSMHSQNAQAGVSLKPLHFEDAEIAEQGQDANM